MVVCVFASVCWFPYFFSMSMVIAIIIGSGILSSNMLGTELFSMTQLTLGLTYACQMGRED